MHLPLRLFKTCSLCLGLVTATLTCFAQDQKGPQWSSVLAVRVKPDMRPSFEAFQKEVSAAYKKAGISRVVVQTIAGDLNEYVSVTPIAKLAELSGPSVLERALGQEASAALLQKSRGLYDEMHRSVTADRPDLSLRSGVPGMYAVVVITRALPGHGADYENLMKSDILPAYKKIGMTNVWTSQTIFGGAYNEMAIVVPVKDTGELDAGSPLIRALGPEAGAKVASKLSTLAESTELRLVKVRPELSNMPEGMPPAPNK